MSSAPMTNEIKFVLPERGNRVVHRLRIHSRGGITIEHDGRQVMLDDGDSITITISCMDEVPRIGQL